MKTRAVLVYGPDRTGCEDVEIPGPESGEVLVRAAFSCVSPGTELRCLANPGGVCVSAYPYVGGYSMSGGRYVIQGSYAQNVGFPYDAAFQRELSVWFSRDSQRDDLKDAMNLIASGRLKVADLLENEYCPENATQAYSELRNRETAPMTAVFRWESGAVFLKNGACR